MFGDVRFDNRLYDILMIFGIRFGFMARIISRIFDFNIGNVKQMDKLGGCLFVILNFTTTIFINCDISFVRKISANKERTK